MMNIRTVGVDIPSFDTHAFDLADGDCQTVENYYCVCIILDLVPLLSALKLDECQHPRQPPSFKHLEPKTLRPLT